MAQSNWGKSEQVMAHLKRLAEKADSLKSVADLQTRLLSAPEDAEAYIHLARHLKFLSREDEARNVLEKGCETAPGVDLYTALVDFLEEQNETEAAIQAAGKGAARLSGNLLLRLREALALPIVYRTNDEISLYRERVSARFRKIEATLDLSSDKRRADAFAAVCGQANFYLAYQMHDVREFQMRYAAFVRKVIAAIYPSLLSPVPLQPDWGARRIRVAFISTLFQRGNHPVERTFGGWIENINQSRFETYFYNPRRSADPNLSLTPIACDHYRHLPGDLPDLAAGILRDQLDVLIFLDIGMARRITPLSCMRLAPVQCAAWGHPVTTGSPSIDYYLSSDLMEPANGQDHYSERLVRLPGFGVPYQRPGTPSEGLNATRSHLGLREDAVVYLCCQTTSKYIPAHDDLFARIAQRVPSAQFVFICQNSAVKAAFAGRLKQAFGRLGLDSSSCCLYLPSVSRHDFWALNQASDVYLDTLEWSGFNTTMEAVACGLPIVTLPGAFMRGRQSYAVLCLMGITDTIAADAAGYVEIAVRLGLDTNWRESISRKMESRQDQLYAEKHGVQGLEDFLCEALRERSQQTN